MLYWGRSSTPMRAWVMDTLPRPSVVASNITSMPLSCASINLSRWSNCFVAGRHNLGPLADGFLAVCAIDYSADKRRWKAAGSSRLSRSQTAGAARHWYQGYLAAGLNNSWPDRDAGSVDSEPPSQQCLRLRRRTPVEV